MRICLTLAFEMGRQEYEYLFFFFFFFFDIAW